MSKYILIKVWIVLTKFLYTIKQSCFKEKNYRNQNNVHSIMNSKYGLGVKLSVKITLILCISWLFNYYYNISLDKCISCVSYSTKIYFGKFIVLIPNAIIQLIELYFTDFFNQVHKDIV